jgi:hypothetical protein
MAAGMESRDEDAAVLHPNLPQSISGNKRLNRLSLPVIRNAWSFHDGPNYLKTVIKQSDLDALSQNVGSSIHTKRDEVIAE